MPRMYALLAATGWLWAIFVGVYVIVRLRQQRRGSGGRGFEVVRRSWPAASREMPDEEARSSKQ
jgi:hypothetical protein